MNSFLLVKYQFSCFSLVSSNHDIKCTSNDTCNKECRSKNRNHEFKYAWTSNHLLIQENIWNQSIYTVCAGTIWVLLTCWCLNIVTSTITFFAVILDITCLLYLPVYITCLLYLPVVVICVLVKYGVWSLISNTVTSKNKYWSLITLLKSYSGTALLLRPKLYWSALIHRRK